MNRALGFLTVVAGLFCFPGVAAQAGAYGCPAYQEPLITVTPAVVPERYDNSLSLGQIQAMVGQPNTTYAGMREFPVGLTAANLRLDSSFEVTTRSVEGDPMVCAQISRMDMQAGLMDTTIYMARELPRPSCGFDAVLEHEGRHVATDRWLLAAYVPQLHDLLAGEIRRLGVVRASSAAVAEARLRKAVNDYLGALGASIASERERQQKQIDSPGEYRRLTVACNGELARLLSAYAPRE
ncbi:MAG: hypothetical protein PHY92_07105 [Alphaproteobacteria bacterium]|nr:hypothetical protein [Alphaproteobacteria bacterium]